MTELIYHLSIYGAFVVTGISLWHAWGNKERLAFLGMAMVCGLLIEKATIDLFELHSYPIEHFFLTVWGVPLPIPLAWGVILYASFMAGLYLGLERGYLSIFAGLFAVHLDLAIDAVAIRIPFWTWNLPGVWFDVPIVNFVGWYGVAALSTGTFLYLKDKTENYALVALVSVLVSTTVLMLVIGVWLSLISSSALLEVTVFCAIVVLSIAYLTRMELRPGIHLERFPKETFVAVILIHLFYIQTVLYYGYYRDVPILLYVNIAMLGVAIGVHCLPRLRGNHPKANP